MQAVGQGRSSPRRRSGSNRRGRPRADEAGEVDRRILDTAAELFLRLGFEATTCDLVASRAGAGKATLYVRYANKEELFAAVVRDKVERTLPPTGEIPLQLPLHQRLHAVGEALLRHVLQPEPVAFMRVVVATAHRMPELAKLAVRIGRENGVKCIADAIVAGRDVPDPRERADRIAGKFLDLMFVPHQMRALIGEDPAVLEAEAPAAVSEAIELLSRSGWLTPYE